jgi:hypothetical protein
MFANTDLIHSYTRSQALEDGEQVCRAIYKLAMTTPESFGI